MAAKKELEITGVDRIDGDQILVEFSDESSATYSIDDLLQLKPDRELAEPPRDEDA